MNKNSNQKNIVLIVPAIAREGITKLVATQVNILQELGYVVYLIVLSDLNEDILQELEVRVAKENILRLNQKEAYLSIGNLLSSPSTVIPILKFIKASKTAIALAHGPYAHFIIRLVKCAAAFTGVKLRLIQYFHINQYEQFPLDSFPRLSINTINQLLAKLCDAVHVSVSEAVKEDVQKHLIAHKKHLVLYNPLPLRAGKEGAGATVKSLQLPVGAGGAAPAAYTLLLSNRIEHSKGQLFFVEVLERLIRTYRLQPPDIKLLIAGDGVQRQELLSLIGQKKLREYVHYLGLLSTPELAVVLRQADLVVVPSMFEGFSFTTLEALEAGCLVLVSDAGGLKEVVQQGITGFVFEAGNAEECFQRLSYFYKNRNEKLINKEDIVADLHNRFSFECHKEKLGQMLKVV